MSVTKWESPTSRVVIGPETDGASRAKGARASTTASTTSRCSRRSLSDRSSHDSAAASVPATVPAMGRLRICAPRRSTSNSGLAPTTSSARNTKQAGGNLGGGDGMVGPHFVVAREHHLLEHPRLDGREGGTDGLHPGGVRHGTGARVEGCSFNTIGVLAAGVVPAADRFDLGDPGLAVFVHAPHTGRNDHLRLRHVDRVERQRANSDRTARRALRAVSVDVNGGEHLCDLANRHAAGHALAHKTATLVPKDEAGAAQATADVRLTVEGTGPRHQSIGSEADGHRRDAVTMATAPSVISDTCTSSNPAPATSDRSVGASGR
jgi:hypothetical protein